MKRICSLLIVIVLMMVSVAPILSGQWTSNPANNTAITTMSGDQALPKIAVDLNGFEYVSWFSNEAGNYNVRLQRLDLDGNALWPQNGVLVSSEPQMTWITDYDLTVDNCGHAIVTFMDFRTGQTNPVAYRISMAGELIWGPTGILLANNTNFDPSPKVSITTSGASVFAWQSIPDGGNSQVRLQKISPAGQKLWGDGIILSQAGIEYTSPYLLPSDNDSMYLIWHKETGPFWSPDRGLYVQKLDVDGNLLWPSDVEVYAPVPSGPVVYLEMCRDHAGGIIFSWYRGSGIDHFHSYVQRMDATGAITMPANGVLVSTSVARNHMYPVPAFLTQTQEVVLFFSEQSLNQNLRGMYAQKLDLSGNRLWGDEGIQLIGLSNNDYGLFMADGRETTAICIYQAAEFGNVLDAKIQAVMLDSQGNFVWPQQFVDLSTVQSQKLHNVMTRFFMGQWIVVWQDRRTDDGDIYAQNIQPNGSLGVVTNQAPIADFTWSPAQPTTQSVVQFTDLSSDPDGSVVQWAWDLGDGNSSSMQHPTHQYTAAGTYWVWLTVTDDQGATGSVFKDVQVQEQMNAPPESPVIDGPVQLRRFRTYEFTFVTIDPDNDDVYYFIDWGDGTTTDWLGPFFSGQEITESHRWSEKGNFTIRAQAKDIAGAESDWGTFSVSTPVSYTALLLPLWMRALERLAHIFPVLRYLLGF